METIELVRLACYIVNMAVCFTLATYFLREYVNKRLRASLAWGLGFGLLAPVILTQVFTFAVVVSRYLLMLGLVLAAMVITFFYYGTSLLFFAEGSFFRERMAVIYFVVMLIIGEAAAYTAPAGQIVESIRLPTAILYTITYLLIGIQFSRVSRRLPKEDPRRRTTTLVSAGWLIVALWMVYQGVFWGEYAAIESVVFLVGSFGFLLLLYGMTTGKTTRS